MERKRKDNSRKHFSAREQWVKRKREGRPKQAWVWQVEPVKNHMEAIIVPGRGAWVRTSA